MDDKRVIGSTPGSVMVFADIPQDSEGKMLQIKMQSPYEDYATYMTKMVVGDRDVAILYSNLIFISLMMAPLFTELYLFATSDYYKKWMRILIAITVINIIVQLTLQSFNILDFMNMAFVSHGLLTIVIVVVLIMEFNNVRRRKKMDVAFLGIFSVAICAAIDLVRSYMIKVGDLGKYSRVGVFIFGISMVITCINELVQKQVKFAENEKAELISAERLEFQTGY